MTSESPIDIHRLINITIEMPSSGSGTNTTGKLPWVHLQNFENGKMQNYQTEILDIAHK